MKKFSARRIYAGDGNVWEDKVIITDDMGTILSVEDKSLHPDGVRFIDGIITPGHINTHCHLELSHLKGKAPTGTGLIPFITHVVTSRDAAPEAIQDAIVQADREMADAGIVAVGDISNKSDTAAVKKQSDLDYYTFVEMFDFLHPGRTAETLQQYLPVFDQQSADGHNKKSLVPHAPYSVSEALFAEIALRNTPGGTISIHNQETPSENELFLHKKGGFVDFYEKIGIDLHHFEAPGNHSIHYALQHLDPESRTLFVHNTLTTSEDIKSAHAWSSGTFWATCANANLYIENRLPDYNVFIQSGAKMTIGTDSLTSNWQLSVWEEVKTIKKYASYVPLDTLIEWSTLNGAKALGYEDRLGSIVPGKKPGLVAIENIKWTNFEPDISASTSRKII